MNKLFYTDASGKTVKTYGELVEDIKQAAVYNKYCFEDGYYNIFLRIILSLLYGREIILLDSDFSREEIVKLIGDADLRQFDTPLDSSRLEGLNEENLAAFIRERSGQWSLTLFTSGTTGLPKSVRHNFETITRFVKQSADRDSDVWGFAYNPTHMAGLQVFFQAFLNMNPIVRLFQLPKETIFEEISAHKITHISATPTFYRLLFPSPVASVPSVVRITSGGEKFDQSAVSRLRQVFVNAKVTNVYASTEAGTLFGSSGNEFELKDRFRGLVRVVDDELMLHKSLMGASDSISLSGEWYPTGDLVEIVSREPLKFRFQSRKSEMINVGGYKVNPREVEEFVELIEGVRQSRVYPRQNAILGNVVCCDVVVSDPEVTEQRIRLQLAGKLQEYKIPRIIRICDSIEQTRSGKIKR